VAIAALSVACVLLGPTPGIVEQLERIHAVAIADQAPRRRRRHRPPPPPEPPTAGRPTPVRP
jgi:hypothetical protein